PVAEVFDNPQHDYTKMLLATEPRGRPAPVQPAAPEILRGDGIKVHFPIKRGVLRRTVATVKAVDGVSIAIREGETLGLVGESGSGKTTLGLAMLRLETSEGPIRFEGKDIQGLDRAALRPLRRRMQIVFQDPYGSLSPRMTVGEIVGEGLRVHELRQVQEAAGEAGQEARRKRNEEAEIDSVIGFTSDTPADRIAEVMADLSMRFAPGRLIDGFQRQWKGGRMNGAQKRALIHLATEPDHARRISGYEAGMLALQVCDGDVLLTEHFLRRYSALLDAVPDAMADGPSNA
ncbi:ATP-binding cassette domain-containing protein, partial [Cylindrospermopsis raciborskii CS-506_B]